MFLASPLICGLQETRLVRKKASHGRGCRDAACRWCSTPAVRACGKVASSHGRCDGVAEIFVRLVWRARVAVAIQNLGREERKKEEDRKSETRAAERDATPKTDQDRDIAAVLRGVLDQPILVTVMKRLQIRLLKTRVRGWRKEERIIRTSGTPASSW
jgi:hypothetical protein